MREPRIHPDMSMMDAIVALADGVPGAITVLAEMVKHSERIDPNAAFGAWNPLLLLDSTQCYGSRIWMLYKDVCGHDLVKTLAVLRAVQLGHIGIAQFDHAVDNRGDGLIPENVLTKVQERFPEFGKVLEEQT